MAFCSNCGNEIENDAKFCSFCGAQQNSEKENPADIPIEDFAEKKPSGQLNVGMLVWSIINLLLCCQPLGIASLIFTILANGTKTAEDEAKKLKIAKTCNLIGTIGGAVIILLYVILMVAGVTAGLYY